MRFKLRFTPEAEAQRDALEKDSPEKFKKVRKTLGLMQTNLRHPSLNTHKFQSLSRQLGVDVFEAYVETGTPGAYRVFWFYGPRKGEITIVSITPHP